ncbi:ATP-binding protein [Planomonospora parontospora subsp. parontospora]|uniref:ATP-binding protein n=2 Tax=Planomonospora parontospora TaxID=58119 RepID=A0AA37F7V8_9ACTN|nr:AAA family ATPase [Planomonospora parontospora]GGK96110.1 ATP-binding protein [Planomonospora parontospora]GII12628.1 ATP-binding protein [Planomonospora parontospora subsp. parontospora]
MIIWLNGTFGAGKTTTAEELAGIVPGARVFDAEYVGYMLRAVPGLPEVRNFQQWPPWRGLVVQTAVQLLAYLGGVLVIPQTVLVEEYWTEIRLGLEKAGIPVHHFVLHSDDDTLIHRIETDAVEAGARQWRLDHLPDYRRALSWLSREAQVVDTTGIPPAQVARIVAARAEAGS